MISQYLEEKGVKIKYLHFPRLEEGIYGKLVARFLRGEMGDISQVDPYLVALIFAGDRLEAKSAMEKWMDDDYLVIVDRFVYSNIAFQAAKINDNEERKKLADWIIDLEFNHHKLPKPDINIFLDVPFDFTRRRLSEHRSGDDRDYLNGKMDIHERDLHFQEEVRKVYKEICAPMGDLMIINCADEQGKMKSATDIFSLLKNAIESFKK